MPDKNERLSFEGLWWPLFLSAAIILSSFGYLVWKLWHPREGDWPAGDTLAMLKAVTLADAGQFLSGVTGALVFIWIIFTYRAQREELALQREEMKAQRKEFEKLAGEAHSQSQLLEQTAAMNKRDAFLRYLSMHERELAMATADFLRSVSSNIMEVGQISTAWENFEKGDHYAFYRLAMSRIVRGQHVSFMDTVNKVMGAGGAMRWLQQQAEAIVRDAEEVSEELALLCRSTPWFRMAQLFDSTLSAAEQDRLGSP